MTEKPPSGVPALLKAAVVAAHPPPFSVHHKALVSDVCRMPHTIGQSRLLHSSEYVVRLEPREQSLTGMQHTGNGRIWARLPKQACARCIVGPNIKRLARACSKGKDGVAARSPSVVRPSKPRPRILDLRVSPACGPSCPVPCKVTPGIVRPGIPNLEVRPVVVGPSIPTPRVCPACASSSLDPIRATPVVGMLVRPGPIGIGPCRPAGACWSLR